jgi:hypothetical protein
MIAERISQPKEYDSLKNMIAERITYLKEYDT